MHKKYIFVDLDGTIIDHTNHEVPSSAVNAIDKAMANGHEVILTTGRPPCLFYGIDKQLKLHSYIGANGRVAVHHDEVIYSEVIDTKVIEQLVDVTKEMKIDIAFEGMNDFALQSTFDTIYPKFSNHFDIEVPKLNTDFYKNNPVFQVTMYYMKDDFKKFEKIFPTLSFELSCKYGIDVNTKGGLKEKGIQVFMNKYKLTQDDIIVIGDGFNDISMLQFAKNSVAMGNAHDSVKEVANFVTKHVSDDGLEHAFKYFNLI